MSCGGTAVATLLRCAVVTPATSSRPAPTDDARSRTTDYAISPCFGVLRMLRPPFRRVSIAFAPKGQRVIEKARCKHRKPPQFVRAVSLYRFSDRLQSHSALATPVAPPLVNVQVISSSVSDKNVICSTCPIGYNAPSDGLEVHSNGRLLASPHSRHRRRLRNG